MLLSYQTQTARLLGNPSGVPEDFLLSDITKFINTARSQMAAETKCVQVDVTFTLTVGRQAYTFPSIPGNSLGVASITSVQTVSRPSGNGFLYLTVKPWEWFRTYVLNTTAQASGAPTLWTQYSPGGTGSVYVSPLPDSTYTLVLDAICQPLDLVLDSDIEAIPYPWTDAVPYFAASLALTANGNTELASFMYSKYTEFAGRAEMAARPAIPPDLFAGKHDMMLTNKLGLGHPKKSASSEQ